MPRYTPEQLAKRNASVWTDIQTILAPLQFFIFLGGVTLNTLFYFDLAGIDFYWISVAILFKTIFFAIPFITGMFFEKEIFDQRVYFERVSPGGCRQRGGGLFPSALFRDGVAELSTRCAGYRGVHRLPDLRDEHLAVSGQAHARKKQRTEAEGAGRDLTTTRQHGLRRI